MEDRKRSASRVYEEDVQVRFLGRKNKGEGVYDPLFLRVAIDRVKEVSFLKSRKRIFLA